MNYQLIHNQIIERAQQRVPAGYTENHHIIPKCIGGNNSEENLVRLTAREHFIVHKLLAEIYPNEAGLMSAVWMMATMKRAMGRDYHVGAREYGRLRESNAIYMSIATKKRWENPEFRARATAGIKAGAQSRPPKSEEARRNIGLSAKGRIDTEEAKRNKAEAQKKRWSCPIERARMSTNQNPYIRTPEIIAMHSAVNKGRKHIHNPYTKKTMSVKEPLLSELLNSGWIIGRLPKDK